MAGIGDGVEVLSDVTGTLTVRNPLGVRGDLGKNQDRLTLVVKEE
jgi:hypothetical protein